MRGNEIVRFGVLHVAAMLACVVAPAQAAFPGANGKLAYSSEADGDSEIYVVNPDGTGTTQLTSNTASDTTPAWSPDGAKILFTSTRAAQPGVSDVWVMNADGSNPQRLIEGGPPDMPRAVGDPTWSPDGTKFAYVRYDYTGVCGSGSPFPGPNQMHVANADGSSPTEIHEAWHIRDPSWSPDGTDIAISRWQDCFSGVLTTLASDGSAFTEIGEASCEEEWEPNWSPSAAKIVFVRYYKLHIINRDGTGDAGCVGGLRPSGDAPVWSPDGTKIAFVGGSGRTEIHVVNPDFTGEATVTSIGTGSAGLDWQPLPINAYPRPKGAAPVRASLVPAYAQCASPNRTHGPPLAFGSCHPPAQASDELTVGSPDANGKAARSTSFVTLGVQVGNPATLADEADVPIRADINDLYTQAGLADYGGELRGRVVLRITDKLNAPHPGGPGAGTVSDTTYGFTIPCAVTADPATGGACTLATTADALVPGTVVEGKRAIWQMGRVEVDDGGADADAETAADNTLFLTQGLFIP